MSWRANAAVPYLKGLSWLVLSRFISSLLFDASSRTTLSCIVIVLSSVSGCCASHSVGFSAWSPDARSFLLNSALANMYKSIFKLKLGIMCFKQYSYLVFQRPGGQIFSTLPTHFLLIPCSGSIHCNLGIFRSFCLSSTAKEIWQNFFKKIQTVFELFQDTNKKIIVQQSENWVVMAVLFRKATPDGLHSVDLPLFWILGGLFLWRFIVIFTKFFIPAKESSIFPNNCSTLSVFYSYTHVDIHTSLNNVFKILKTRAKPKIIAWKTIVM